TKRPAAPPIATTRRGASGCSTRTPTSIAISCEDRAGGVQRRASSVRFRANFPNKEHRLWPGELINAWLLLDTRHDGLTGSASAVQQGPQGPYVYVINADSTVAMRPVKVAQVSGGRALIDSGLAAGASRWWSTGNTSCSQASM